MFEQPRGTVAGEMKSPETERATKLKREHSETVPARILPTQVDRVVTRIIRTLRRGHPARLPGLGTLIPGEPWTFDPEPAERPDEP